MIWKNKKSSLREQPRTAKLRKDVKDSKSFYIPYLTTKRKENKIMLEFLKVFAQYFSIAAPCFVVGLVLGAMNPEKIINEKIK